MTKLRFLVQAALAQLSARNSGRPSIWEEHSLIAALHAINEGRYDDAERFILDFGRPPSAHDLASLDWSGPRLSTAAINQAFAQVEWN
jgi:hypothetical protein